MKLSSKQALDKAREAQSAGHNKTAEKIYRAILQTQPKNAEANYQLGVLLESHGDYNSALVPFKTALEITPSNSKFLVSYLENLISAKKFSSATEFIENVSKRGFNLELIESYRRKLVDATADSSIQKSSSSPSHLAKTKINSSDSVPPEEEVETLIVSYNRGEFDKARNLASALTTNYPNHPTGWNILGAVLGQLGRYEEAAAVGERLTSLLPRDHSALTNLGTTYASLGKLEEALTCHQRALNLKPDFAEAHCNLGFALKDLARHDEALKSFNESLKFQPKLAQANVGLGLVFEELGNHYEAEKYHKKAIHINPNLFEAYNNLGNTQHNLGRFTEAEKSFSRAIELNPKFTEAYSNLGATLDQLGKYQQAERSLRMAVKLNPSYSQAHHNLASKLVSSKNIQEAIKHFNLSKLPESKLALAKALYEFNDKKSLLDLLDNYIKGKEVHPLIGSVISRSNHRYKVSKRNYFCERPLDFVQTIDLNEFCDFSETFVSPANRILSDATTNYTDQKLLTNARQTAGNIFFLRPDMVAEIELTIRDQIEKYRQKFEGSTEGLIQKWPEEYTLFGWFLKMDTGGQIAAHMHEKGWLSGSVYINVPPKEGGDDGNLVVCIEDDRQNGKNMAPLKIIDVVTGSLALFPASLLHYTIPFKSKENRIVLAFDVKPAE